MRKWLTPANVAWLLSVLITCLWVLWGVPEMFHEGWYAPFEWLFFLLPAIVMLSLTLLALRWPRMGALLFVALGLGFGILILWQVRPGGGRSTGWTIANLLSWIPVTFFLVVVGASFFLGRRARWRAIYYLAAVGLPLVLGLVLAVAPAYRVSRRLDDGDRSERWILGNGVALRWAPAGPGWNRDGGVAWNEVALYGKGVPGFEGKRFGDGGLCNGAGGWTEHCATEQEMMAYNVCLHLNQDGTQLMLDWQGIWRMPTTDEVVRSLVRHGAHAGCTWDGTARRAVCAVRPDKETPLWDPQSRVVYYWTSDEADQGNAHFVVYHGAVVATPKYAALGSRGYRCVRSEELE
jgi:hypothetical protein